MPCGTLVTMVKDSGCGMQEETKKRLFQIFGNIKRVNEGEQGVIRTQGIGLGLSICKELVQFLGGWIKCESEIDMGSQFSFGIKTMCEECRQSENIQNVEQPSQTISDSNTELVNGTMISQLAKTMDNPSYQEDFNPLNPYQSEFTINDRKGLN